MPHPCEISLCFWFVMLVLFVIMVIFVAFDLLVTLLPFLVPGVFLFCLSSCSCRRCFSCCSSCLSSDGDDDSDGDRIICSSSTARDAHSCWCTEENQLNVEQGYQLLLHSILVLNLTTDTPTSTDTRIGHTSSLCDGMGHEPP